MPETADKSPPLGPVSTDESDEPPELEFGKYRLLRKIAVGGMAEVYLAKSFGQFGFEKPVVVKVLLPKLSADEEFREMFVREAVMAADFRHPRLCQVYDVGEANGLYYICMEFVDGVDLTRVVRRAREVGSPLSRALAIRLVLDLLDGLQYVHNAKGADGSSLDIVHRDVTPQNIMVAFDGQVKLVDFGVAKTRLAGELKHAALKGKGPYMAPEQWRGGDLDGRADLFALGIVLYELTVGKRLFKRGNPNRVKRAILAGEVTPPREIRPDYPAALEAVVMRALALDPADRFQRAAEFSDALGSVARSEGLRATTEQMARFVSRLFEDVCRSEVFRPLELTAPGHALEAMEAARREASAQDLQAVEAERSSTRRRRLALAGLGALLLGLGFLTGSYVDLGQQGPATSRAAVSRQGVGPALKSQAGTPAALRGCRATFSEVRVDRDGRVRRVGGSLHLRCKGQEVPRGDPRRARAREIVRHSRFEPWRVHGEPVSTTTPITLSF